MSEAVITSAAPESSAPQSATEGASSEVSNKQDSGSKSQASEAITAAQKEKFKLVVDGQEIEEEIDFSDKEGLKKRFQLAHAAKKRMTEAQEDKKKAFNIIKEFESNPESMLARLGPKGREIAEKFLLSQIQDEMLSPEEKEYRDLKKYKESTEAEKAKIREASEKQIAAQKENEYAQAFQATIIEALNKTGLPPAPSHVKRMASLMSKNLEYGLDLSADDLAQELLSDLRAEHKAMYGNADGSHLINLFGPDIAKKIRKHDLKELEEKQSKVFQKAHVPSQGQSQSNQKDYETMEEWKERIANNLRK